MCVSVCRSLSINTCFTARLQNWQNSVLEPTDFGCCFFFLRVLMVICYPILCVSLWLACWLLVACRPYFMYQWGVCKSFICSLARSLKTYSSVCHCFGSVLKIGEFQLISNRSTICWFKVAQLKWLTLTLQLWLNWFCIAVARVTQFWNTFEKVLCACFSFITAFSLNCKVNASHILPRLKVVFVHVYVNLIYSNTKCHEFCIGSN